MEKTDIAVIGGGASGLAAAAAAGESGRSVVLLEKEPRVGKKLLATGNGRCNLTNERVSPPYYRGGKGMEAVLDVYPPKRVENVFLSWGLFCSPEEEGRVYPNGRQASAVLDVLRLRLQRLKVRELCGNAAVSLSRRSDGILVTLASGEKLEASRVILAAGGMASPQLGSDGSGFSLARSLGHSLTPVFPSLVQIRTDPALTRPLKGMRAEVSAAFLADGRELRRERGEVQFTENSLSGICIFQLSRFAGEFQTLGTAGGRKCRRPELSLDLLPAVPAGEELKLLQGLRNSFSQLPAAELLGGLLNKRIGQEVMKRAELPPRLCGELTDQELEKVSALLRDFRFPVRGVMPWQNAQVTAGGIPLTEVELPSLRSKKCPFLYLAGELLDVDGDCGGFNLHWAWASGLAAGTACGADL